MPAEWEPQAAIWLSWPHNHRTWSGHFRPIPAKFAEIVAVISRFEPVRINVAAPLRAHARRLIGRAGGDPAHIAYFDHATDDCWCRDHGPIFVKHAGTGEVALTDWKFNAWGRKYPRYARDNRIPWRIGRALDLRRFPVDQILEGGSIDVNGAGLLLTTESCLLNPNRNPHLSRTAIERSLRDNLGVTRIIWLGAGIAGDDTDGHVDDLSRFFHADGIVTAVERDPNDANYGPLRENRERLADLRTPAGRRFTIVELPTPHPCHWRG
jgi:agmatine deiminase